MKLRSNKQLGLCLFLTAVASCFCTNASSKSGTLFEPSAWGAVSDERLGKMRGGFVEATTGFTVSFGIVRTVSINGDVVNTTSFNLPDVTKITVAQANMASAAIAESNIIQNGTGNFIDPSVKAQLGGGTFIQNSLNDQTIKTLTVINAGVNSMGILKSMNAQSALKDALIGSISTR